jgi:hypothetical protein
MLFSGQCLRGDTNNHPQTLVTYICEAQLQPAGLLLAINDQHGNDWYQIAQPVPIPSNGLYLEVAGSSVMDQGYNMSDEGVLITCTFWQNGIEINLACNDCGSEGNNWDYDFNDKFVNLWFPLVYGVDFKKIQVASGGPYAGRVLEFI